LHPDHNLKIGDLYTEIFFNYNIIDESEYKENSWQFNFREAGCQTSFLPYGQKNLTLFLAALISKIFIIIQTNDQRNLHIAGKGNKIQQSKNDRIKSYLLLVWFYLLLVCFFLLLIWSLINICRKVMLSIVRNDTV